MLPAEAHANQTNDATEQTRILADGEELARGARGYALPYYTRGGGDTEFLISNPNPAPVFGTLTIYGRECRIAERLSIEMAPNCTQTFRIGPIVPNHAGHVILAVNLPVVAHLLYLRGGDSALTGGELAGVDNLLQPLDGKGRTYVFGYRTVPLGNERLDGAVFVSNPHTAPLGGRLDFFDENCKPVANHEIAIHPGCTAEYPFPRGTFGYGRIEVSDRAVINVLHLTSTAQGVAAAELLGEANRI
jgi:hypothetical protein